MTPIQGFNLLYMNPNWGIWTLDFHLKWKTFNRPKEMNVISTKVLLWFFSFNLPICSIYFHLVMPRHVLNPCYARYEHIRGIKGYVISMLCEVTSAKDAWVSLEKIWMGQKGQIGKKNRRSTFVLITFISLTYLIFSV
jgi:hypothetical protein